MYAEYAIVYTKYLLEIKDYKKALAIADHHRHKMVQNSEDSPLLELTFLTSLGYYHTGETKTAYIYFKNTFYAAHSIESCYASICRNYVSNEHMFVLDDYLSQMDDIPQITFPIKKTINTSDLTDGTYDFFSTDVLTIGRLIHELRTEQGLSLTSLCQGLCSKSKLSKIENDALQPDVFLTEALLQRLGISECGFTFWGSERESRLYELKFKLTHTRLLTNEQIENYLHQFHSLITKKDNILMQRYTFDCNLLSSSPEECIQNLHTALAYTLPDFDIRFIYNYHLSHSELSILNNIGFQYRNIDGNKSKLYFAKLLDYLSVHSLDILFINSIFPLTLYKYEHSLYTQHHYHEAADLFTSSNHQLLKGNLATFGYFLFYYCQCLAECQQYESATKFAHYACSIQELYELNANSEVLKKDFLKDFSINII